VTNKIDANGDEPGEAKPATAIAAAILEIVAAIPGTKELPSAEPSERARSIRTTAALKAAAISGSLALPAGPLAIFTVLPDLIAVWRIQSQMVADIAATFGKTATLSQEQMIYCLFRHAAAQVVRDLGARVGERFVFRQATLQLVQQVAQRLGVKVSQRVIVNSAARWIPILGSLGVAGYAYYDTAQVGATATELFQKNPGPAQDELDQAN
jgi:hypothetical protein